MRIETTRFIVSMVASRVASVFCTSDALEAQISWAYREENGSELSECDDGGVNAHWRRYREERWGMTRLRHGHSSRGGRVGDTWESRDGDRLQALPSRLPGAHSFRPAPKCPLFAPMSSVALNTSHLRQPPHAGQPTTPHRTSVRLWALALHLCASPARPGCRMAGRYDSIHGIPSTGCRAETARGSGQHPSSCSPSRHWSSHETASRLPISRTTVFRG